MVTSDIVEPSNFALVEYKPDGSLDPTFGDGGIVETEFAGQDTLSGIVVEPDGKIVASGTGGYNGHGYYVDGFALARYKPDGSLDFSITTPDLTAKPKRLYVGGPPVLQHRKILVAGALLRYPGGQLLLARYNSDFSLDRTFGKHAWRRSAAPRDRHPPWPPSGTGRSWSPQRAPSFGFCPTVDSIRVSVDAGSCLSGIRVRPLLPCKPGKKSWWERHTARLDARPAPWRQQLHRPQTPRQDPLEGAQDAQGVVLPHRSHLQSVLDQVAWGQVISTATPPGDRLPDGTKVDLAVSRGRRTQRP